MRIAIDMQGAQTESRFRGIGRYTMSFTKAIVRNRGLHEIYLVLSGLFPETIEPIRIAFNDILPQENIRIWNAPGPVNEMEDGNSVRRKSAEVIREAFIESLKPDVIHISSLFEGFGDDAVTSIGIFDKKTPVSVMSYDFIPLLNPGEYFDNNKKYKSYYLSKIESIKRASLYLAISEYTMRETIEVLELSNKDTVINISTAVDDKFKPEEPEQKKWEMIKKKIGIRKKFILYTGGADKRKNLERLIKAYAKIPQELLSEYQLVFAGKMPQPDIVRMIELADQIGLSTNALLFTGYITDKELVQLYNICSLYVFPSWHEGFGLPALEAMSCGALVIGSNTSSLPEVIGWDKALFNPFDIDDITDKIIFSLKNENFRKRLKLHGLRQSKKFSWDHSALKALDSWEKTYLPYQCNSYTYSTLYEDRLLTRLVAEREDYNSDDVKQLSIALALNQSGSLEKQLFLDVSEICQSDAATGVQRVVRSFLIHLLNSAIKGFRVEPVYATREHDYKYARKFSSKFLNVKDTGIVDESISWLRGDIFFGLDMQHHVQLQHKSFYNRLIADGVTVKFLVYDLLPIQLADLFKDDDAKELHENWLKMIANTDGAICISRATADAFDSWILNNKITKSKTFHTSWIHIGADISSSVPSKGLPQDADDTVQKLRGKQTFVCVSTLEPRKGQQQILEAFNILWNENYEINLVFVGKKGWKIDELEHQISFHNKYNINLFWLQGISDQYLEKNYSASHCLIAASLNEGFGLSLVEAAQHGLSIIARDIPVFREIAGDHATYFKGQSPDNLSGIIKGWLIDYNKKQHVTAINMPWLTWKQSTEQLKNKLTADGYWPNQILVDISELARKDVGTGIQRVVRNVLREWMSNPPDKYRIELVYATSNHGYRYARSFSQKYEPNTYSDLIDEPVCYAPGDIFFALDFQPQVQSQQKDFYQYLLLHGVQVLFLVHDLIPIKHPEFFPDGNKEGFESWLHTIIISNGLICVSKSTAIDLETWILENSGNFNFPIKIAWTHNGADLEVNPQKILSTSRKGAIKFDLISQNKSFLMVGTIEPRKGYQDVLNAFDVLWAENLDLNLIIIGKVGWGTAALVDRIISHPEFNKRLFLFHGISDEELNQLYSICVCLIAASYDEGFGLPLIEAARYGLPIIARDISVFREVAGNYAYYFSDENLSDNIPHAIKSWLSLFEEDKHPKSSNISSLTWKESAENLLRIVLDINNDCYLSVLPNGLCQLSKKYNHQSNRLSWEYGWSHPEIDFRWSEGYESAIYFTLSFSDACLCNCIALELHTLNNQHVLICLNDHVIYDDAINFENGSSELKIYSHNFNEGKNKLIFKLPDAKRSGGGDPRILSIALHSLILHNVTDNGLVLGA